MRKGLSRVSVVVLVVAVAVVTFAVPLAAVINNPRWRSLRSTAPPYRPGSAYWAQACSGCAHVAE